MSLIVLIVLDPLSTLGYCLDELVFEIPLWVTKPNFKLLETRSCRRSEEKLKDGPFLPGSKVSRNTSEEVWVSEKVIRLFLTRCSETWETKIL